MQSRLPSLVSGVHSNHDLAAWCSSEVSIWGRCHSIQSVIYSYTFILLVILVNNLELPPWPVRSTLSPFEAPLSILATPFKKCWRLSANVERFSAILGYPLWGPFEPIQYASQPNCKAHPNPVKIVTLTCLKLTYFTPMTYVWLRTWQKTTSRPGRGSWLKVQHII